MGTKKGYKEMSFLERDTSLQNKPLSEFWCNESASAVSTFYSSIEKCNVQYSHYIGDGDTESFRKVVDSKLYGMS